MKTAMQELIFEFYSRSNNDFQFWIKDNYEYLLKKEKEQLKKAFEDFTSEYNNGEEYYNQTYNQNK